MRLIASSVTGSVEQLGRIACCLRTIRQRSWRCWSPREMALNSVHASQGVTQINSTPSKGNHIQAKSVESNDHSKEVGGMSERQCSVEECDKPYYAKGYCKRHYLQWYRWGDPLIVKHVKYASPEESFEARTMPVTETGCLLWTGGTSAGGYGYISVG